MLYNKAIYEPVENLFNDKRVRARRNIEARRNEIYVKFPEYKEIETEISRLGIKLGRIALEGGQKDVEEIKSGINELSKKRKKILTDAGLSENYIYDVYECRKCSDSGYIDGEMCDCFADALAAEIAKRSNISKMMERVSFDDFNLEYYPDVTNANGENPRKRIIDILNKATEFINNFGKPGNKNLIFYGNPGLGKTFLSSAIANTLAENGITVMYYTAKQLLKMLTENEFSQNGEYKSDCKWAHEVDLLIIDDLGTEHTTQYTVASLFDIINSRMISGKQIIINTNMAPMDLGKTYSTRIFSRLTEFEILKFIGRDIREMKNM